MLTLYADNIARDITSKIAALSEVKSKEGATFKVIATNETKDRDNEVVKVDGWDFNNYMKNPVILSNHHYTIESIVGKATKLYVEDGNVVVEWVFADTPTGELAQRLYNGGFLKTVSVGFIPKERRQDDYRIITRAELLEISFVPVPSNPSALSLDAKSYKDAQDSGLVTSDTDEKSISFKELWNIIFAFRDEIFSLRSELSEVKELLTAKKAKETLDYEIKEQVQTAERAISSALRNFKLKNFAS